MRNCGSSASRRRSLDLFNVVPGDEGRSITDFTHTLDYNDLAADARSVLLSLVSSEREVRSLKSGWRLMRMKPYRTVEDRIEGVVITFVDIGERRRAEDALRDSEARTRAVIDGVADAIVTIDEPGIIQALNVAATAMFGYSADELLGRDVTLLVPEPHHALHRGYIERYLGRAKRKSLESAAKSRRSARTVRRFRWNSWSPRPRMVENGSSLGSSATSASGAGSRRGSASCTATVSILRVRHGHGAGARDQPAACGGGDLSLHPPPSPRRQGRSAGSAVDEALNKTSSQLNRAGQLIAHLRDFVARGEPDKLEHGVHDLIRRACDLIAPSAKEADVEVLLSLNAAEDKVLVDRIQIEQALVNLMRNAIEAMDDRRCASSPLRPRSTTT